MRTKLILAAIAAASLGTATSAQTVQNGSFETGAIDPGVFTTLGAGSTTINGWTVTPSSIDYIGTYWGAQDGSRSIDLSGNAPGGVSQVITGLTTGALYQVDFFLGGNYDGPPTPDKTLDVSAAGTTSGFIYSAPSATQTGFSGWTGYSFRFVATGASETLNFQSTTTGSPYGPALDNVSLARVPEPATWALMIMGFGAVGGALRRRKVATTAFA